MIGMLLLTALLHFRVIRLEQVEGMANFLVKNLGFFFVPAAVSLMLFFDIIRAQWIPILLASALSTMLVIVVTGWVHQLSCVSSWEGATMEYLNNMYFLLALTFIVYAASQILQLRTGWTILNPILVSAVVLIAFLKITGVSIETYNEGGRLIEFWLKPAVVALGVPLYKELSAIRKQLLPLLMSELAGCVVGIISLTAAVVICVGIFGGMTGFRVMKLTHIGSPIAQGLSMGTAAHAMGTSRAMDVSGKYGAFASLGLTINGIFTALLTPTILDLMGML